MRLALAMGRTLRELEDALGSDEWPLWLAFMGLYDVPDGYFVAGKVAPAAATCFGGGEMKPSDFVPFFGGAPARAQTPEEMAAKFAAAREVLGHAPRR